VKALLSKEIGGPDTLVLEDVPAPECKPGWAVVDVKAVGVNFPDTLIIEDKYQFKPARPFAPGAEIAGVVRAVGDGVTHIKPGDRVLGNAGWGGMAEQVALSEDRLTKIPVAMPYEDAAAFAMTYGTSWHALTGRANLKPGQTLLVLGASGGVGLAAVELGKAIGARVIAACSTQEKLKLCMDRGADDGVVYPSGPLDNAAQKTLVETFKHVCGADGADVVYDAVGGDYAEPALRSIAWEGRYLVVGFAAGGIPKIPLNLALLKGCEIVGVFWGSWAMRNPERNRQSIEELLAMYEAGQVRPFISRCFPLEEGAAAIAHLASRNAVGKVVVTIGGR